MKREKDWFLLTFKKLNKINEALARLKKKKREDKFIRNETEDISTDPTAIKREYFGQLIAYKSNNLYEMNQYLKNHKLMQDEINILSSLITIKKLNFFLIEENFKKISWLSFTGKFEEEIASILQSLPENKRAENTSQICL